MPTSDRNNLIEYWSVPESQLEDELRLLSALGAQSIERIGELEDDDGGEPIIEFRIQLSDTDTVDDFMARYKRAIAPDQY